MSTNAARLGWLGTGRLGAALARRLIEAGEPVTVWNRTPAKTAPLAAAGASVVGRLADLGSCDVVFVTVSGPGDLEEVVAELLSGPSRPGVVVDCSTVSAAASARVRAMAEGRGRLPGRAGQRQPARGSRGRGVHRGVGAGRSVRRGQAVLGGDGEARRVRG